MFGLLVNFDCFIWGLVGVGIVVGLLFIFVVCLVVVVVCMIWFGFECNELFFMLWVGLCGVVFIILVIILMVLNMDCVDKFFDVILVFVVVFICI